MEITLRYSVPVVPGNLSTMQDGHLKTASQTSNFMTTIADKAVMVGSIFWVMVGVLTVVIPIFV